MPDISTLYQDPTQDPTQGKSSQPDIQDPKSQVDPNMVDQDDLPLEMQTFLEDSYNQEMVEKFIRHNLIGLLRNLIENGARLPPNFDRSILDQQPQGEFSTSHIIAPILHPQSIVPAVSIPMISLQPSSFLAYVPLSNPITSILQHGSIPSSSSRPHFSIPQSSIPLKNVANFVNSSLSHATTICGS